MNNQQIILFDGVCNFCNFWINFIIDHDKNNVFKFAALQSDKGQEFLEKYNLNKETFDSFILIQHEKVYDKSTAAFKVSKYLHGIWSYFYFLIFIPKPIRDFIYNIIAKYRYKIFGRRDACRIPTQQEKNRFLA